MVVYLRRSPRDPELSPFHMHRRHLHATVHRVQDAIITRPERDWDMAALASVGNTTERHLLRLFIEHACVSPLHYLRSIRLERARQSLEFGASVTRAAEVAGFRSGLQLRRAWSQPMGRLTARCDAGGQPCCAGGPRSLIYLPVHEAGVIIVPATCRTIDPSAWRPPDLLQERHVERDSRSRAGQHRHPPFREHGPHRPRGLERDRGERRRRERRAPRAAKERRRMGSRRPRKHERDVHRRRTHHARTAPRADRRSTGAWRSGAAPNDTRTRARPDPPTAPARTSPTGTWPPMHRKACRRARA